MFETKYEDMRNFRALEVVTLVTRYMINTTTNNLNGSLVIFVIILVKPESEINGIMDL